MSSGRTLYRMYNIVKSEEPKFAVHVQDKEINECTAPIIRSPTMSCSASTSESESSADDDTIPVFFDVRTSNKELPTVEQDLIQARCLSLRKEMRDRVTLPMFAANRTEVESGIALPMYSCPYKN